MVAMILLKKKNTQVLYMRTLVLDDFDYIKSSRRLAYTRPNLRL